MSLRRPNRKLYKQKLTFWVMSNWYQTIFAATNSGKLGEEGGKLETILLRHYTKGTEDSDP